jgi:hypothetical protein
MANKLDILDCLANELIRQSAATSGKIFVNQLPSKPDDAIALFGQTGSVIGAQRDVPGLKFPRFQLITRGSGPTGYNDAADLAQGARDVLHGMIGVILPHGVNTTTDPYIRILRCHAEYEGGPLGQDDQGRDEFSTNYLVEYHYYDPTP